jgi:hypothetical protein
MAQKTGGFGSGLQPGPDLHRARADFPPLGCLFLICYNLLIVDFDKNEKVASDMVHNGFDQEELIGLAKSDSRISSRKSSTPAIKYS